MLGIVGLQEPRDTRAEDEVEKRCAAAISRIVEINEASEEVFYDAITGQRLRADLVRAARREELEYFSSKRVWTKVLRSMAMQ